MAWLETQDPAQTYEWMDCDGGCLIGQYYAAHGIRNGIYHRVFNGRDLTDYGRVCSSLSGATTFGAALERAKKLLASR